MKKSNSIYYGHWAYTNWQAHTEAQSLSFIKSSKHQIFKQNFIEGNHMRLKVKLSYPIYHWKLNFNYTHKVGVSIVTHFTCIPRNVKMTTNRTVSRQECWWRIHQQTVALHKTAGRICTAKKMWKRRVCCVFVVL